MNAPLARLSALAAVLAGLLVSCPTDPPPKQNHPPVAAFTSSLTVQAMTALAFDAASSSDPDGDALTYTWEFGDGTRGGSSAVAHVFIAAGSFDVRLTVTDPSGSSNSAAKTITVSSRTVSPGAAVSVTGTVLDVSGAVLSGAKVELVGGTTIGSSDAAGKVALSLPTNVSHTLRISKSGYSEQFRVLELPSSAASGFFEAPLTQRGAAQTLDAGAGGSLSSSDGAKLTLGAGSLVDAAGRAVSGAVSINLTPIDVTDSAKVTGFPGAFAGITASGVSSPIVSFGTTEFALSQGDMRLNLAPSKSATIELPIYAALNLDGSPVKVGDSQPLWSLDERSGQWVQEGSGVVVASTASPSGLALRGVVAHFSWWNTDIGFDPSRPKPRCGPDPTIPGAGSNFANETICNMIAEMDRGIGGNSSGGVVRPQAVPPRLPGYRASITIPFSGGVPLAIPAGNNVILRGCALGGTWCGQVTVNQAAGSSAEVFIALRPLSDAPLTVAITSPADTGYSNASQTFQVALGGGLLPDSVEFFNGNTSIGTASNSSFTWYTGNLPEGSYSVTARATLGTRTATSAPVTVIVDRTLPTVISRTPTPSGLGGAGGATQAVFSEAILTSSLTDASVVLKVAGVTVARSLALSADGRTLTITPSAALPVPAEVNVTFGFSATALTDLARNALVNPATPWTWTTSLWSPVGGPAQGLLKIVLYPNMTLAADGQPLVSFASPPSATNPLTDLYVRRFDGANWQNVGGSLSGFSGAGVQSSVYCSAIATDASSDPVVIWQELTDVNQSNYAYYARRFNPATGNWDALGSNGGKLPDFAYNACERTPALSVDSSGRPVVAYTAVSGLLVKRYDGTNWVGLGPDDGNLGRLDFGGFSMALGADGNPVLVGNEQNGFAFVKRYNSSGNTWELIGPYSGKLRSAGLTVGNPRIILDTSGNPLVSGTVGVPYGSSVTQSDVTVFRYTGTDWQEPGPRAAGYGVAVGYEAALALDANGDSVLAYLGDVVNGNNLYVKRFVNSSWQGVGLDSGAVGVRVTGTGFLSLRLGSAGKLLLGFANSLTGGTSTFTVLRSP